MHENVYDPLERYAKEFEKKFYDVVDCTFKQLEQRSGVDRAANQALCRKIKKLEANKEKLESKNSFNRSLRSILVFCIVAILIVGVFSYAKNEVVTSWNVEVTKENENLPVSYGVVKDVVGAIEIGLKNI
jgi:hypothetical protein